MSAGNPYESPKIYAAELPTATTKASFNLWLRDFREVLADEWLAIVIVLLTICLPWDALVIAVSNSMILKQEVGSPLREIILLLLNSTSSFTALLFAEAILTGVVMNRLQQQPVSLFEAFDDLWSYPLLLMWMLTVTTVVLFGSLLCIIPGVYLNIRLMYVIPAVVQNPKFATHAMAQSHELTRSNFMFSAIIFLGMCVPIIGLLIGISVVHEVLEMSAHWSFSLFVTLFSDLLMLLTSVGFACAFHQLQQLALQPEVPLVADLSI